MCSDKTKLYWNEKESKVARSAVLLVQIYLDKAERPMKRGGLVSYWVHAVLLSFTVDLGQNLIHKGNTLMGFLPVDYVELWVQKNLNKWNLARWEVWSRDFLS